MSGSLSTIWVKASALIERQKSLTLSRVRPHNAPILELLLLKSFQLLNFTMTGTLTDNEETTFFMKGHKAIKAIEINCRPHFLCGVCGMHKEKKSQVEAI